MRGITGGVIPRWEPPAPASKSRVGRLLARVLPLVVVIALAGASALFIARGASVREETSQLRVETDRLSELVERADTRSDAAERLATRIDQGSTALVATVLDVGAAQNTTVLAQHDLVAAADATIGRINAGDTSGGKDAFRSGVSVAADSYDVTLAALQSSVKAASDSLASLDVALALAVRP